MPANKGELYSNDEGYVFLPGPVNKIIDWILLSVAIPLFASHLIYYNVLTSVLA